MGACCAQIKGFTLGCRELVLVRPNVKPFICAQHAPIIGKTYKNTRMQKVSKLKKFGKKRNK